MTVVNGDPLKLLLALGHSMHSGMQAQVSILILMSIFTNTMQVEQNTFLFSTERLFLALKDVTIDE